VPVARLDGMTNHADAIVYRTFDGSDARLPHGALAELVTALGGRVSTHGEDYEKARHTWNAMVEHRPAVIAHCASAEDVVAAIVFAREHEILLSVRGGGHHVAGNAVADGGLVIDLSPMRHVRVDAASRRAFVGGGALLGDVDAATQAHGLAAPLGINSTTGFGGLCLGGGFGWLTRRFGLTIDSLQSATLVTAGGERLIVSASGGAVTASAGPTATIRSPSTTRRAFLTGPRPVPSISIPQVIKMDTVAFASSTFAVAGAGRADRADRRRGS